jgi:hypothetical protein
MLAECKPEGYRERDLRSDRVSGTACLGVVIANERLGAVARCKRMPGEEKSLMVAMSQMLGATNCERGA